ncbi:MAG: DUF3078 domain-containing protein [Bacteroidota bacterium]|nr:DUF3078 domain-containing protein [Bacteroidota bacterium]
MKRFIFLCVGIIIALGSNAQEIQKIAKAKEESGAGIVKDTLKHWYYIGNANLNYSQATFSNWASGGQNSMGAVAMVNIKANYTNGKHAWGNTVDLGYGFQMLGKMNDLKTTKTNDKIELTTAYSYQIDKNKQWFFTVLANLRTQFSAGYNYPDDSTVISNFMAPGYLIGGIGITYQPAKWCYVYISPASARFLMVLDKKLSDSGSFGVDKGKRLKTTVGPYFRSDINKELVKNITLASSIELYSDYLNDFGNIDVNWSFLMIFKVNKWLAASISTQLLYDNDVMIKTSSTDEAGPRTQFKELLGIGLTYNFKKR